MGAIFAWNSFLLVLVFPDWKPQDRVSGSFTLSPVRPSPETWKQLRFDHTDDDVAAYVGSRCA
jgi:hypothetical protein